MNFQLSGTKAEGYQLVAGYLGAAAMAAGAVVLLPLLFLLAFPEEMPYAVDFIAPGVASITIGYLLLLFIKGKSRSQLRKHQDSVVIAASWIIAILVSAVPFIMTGRYDFPHAIFEAASGYTATGLTVVDVEQSPKIFLAFRSIMLYFGAVGFVLVMTSVLSDRYGMRLYTATGHNDRLIPNLIASMRTVSAIYAGYIASGTVLYLVFGMSWFDALNHSIAALSTGGFSTKAQSIGAYDSFPIEIVTMVLMLLGSTNFFVHLLIIKGKFSGWLRHCETKLSLVLIGLAAPLICALLLGGVAKDLSRAARLALFQTVSALTTTGFRTTSDFAAWPSSALFILIVLMLVGGGAGSASGGIKQARITILLKSALRNLRQKFNDRRIVAPDTIHALGGKIAISDEDKTQAGLFALVYLAIFAMGTLAYCFFGYSIQDSAFEFASALGTVGFSTGITGPASSSGVLWVGIAGMLLGRLEIYVVFMGFARIAKDAADAIHGR